MTKYIHLAIIVIFVLLIGSTIFFAKSCKDYREKYNIAQINNIAYEDQLASNDSTSKVFQQTMYDIKTSNDSLLHVIDSIKSSRKIKDKSVDAVGYQTSTTSISDTIVLKDTFNIKVDTTIVDKWYSNKIYINKDTIVSTPKVKSERYFILHVKKEYEGGKSKVFFINWFKKKYKVLTVDTEERNPYIDIDKQKFIKILK